CPASRGPQHDEPAALAPRGGPRRGARRRRRVALRRPGRRGTRARARGRRGRPVAPRGRDRHGARPAHVVALDHLAGTRLPRPATERLVLSVNGDVEHAAGVVDDGEATWLVTEAAHAAPLAAWLDSMRFMMRVEVADVTDRWAALGEPVDAEGAEGEPVTWR